MAAGSGRARRDGFPRGDLAALQARGGPGHPLFVCGGGGATRRGHSCRRRSGVGRWPAGQHGTWGGGPGWASLRTLETWRRARAAAGRSGAGLGVAGPWPTGRTLKLRRVGSAGGACAAAAFCAALCSAPGFAPCSGRPGGGLSVATQDDAAGAPCRGSLGLGRGWSWGGNEGVLLWRGRRRTGGGHPAGGVSAGPGGEPTHPRGRKRKVKRPHGGAAGGAPRR